MQAGRGSRIISPKVLIYGQVGSMGTTSVVDRDHVVFAQGDPADALFSIEKGKLNGMAAKKR